MAGDWIKMRVDLFTHPKVVRISSALKADRLRTVGGLMSAWCLFGAHSADGKLDGYTSETLDAHLGWPGFSAALIAVGWLSDDGESLALPAFEAHNGASAKRRAMDADRKRDVRKTSASDADKKRTREEKRREEEKQEPNGSLSAGADRRAGIPYSGIVDLYNATLVRLPKVRELTPKRRALIRSAWEAAPTRRSREFWEAYFAECQDDAFLNGTGPYGADHPNWRPDFDYLLRADVVTRTFERAMHRMEATA